MTDATMGRVQAAIRHRNLSLRVLGFLMAAGLTIAGLAALAQWRWQADAAKPLIGVWPDLATLALGHFALAVTAALATGLIYELMVLRHLRAIARQVRSGDWLLRGETIRLNRAWLGASDDLDRIVGALNDAREHGVETRSALTWQVAERRKGEAGMARRLEAEIAARARLAAVCREQASFAARSAADLRASLAVLAEAAAQGVTGAPDGGNVRPLNGAPGDGRLAAAAERIRVLAAEMDIHARAAGEVDLLPVGLEGVVREAAGALRGRIAAADARVDMSDLPVVRGDRHLLVHLFRDLISRALDAAEPERPLAIRILAGDCGPDGRVMVVVRDTGRSIAPDDPDQVFAAGVAREGAEEAGAPGLALCRRIVLCHGGEIGARPLPAGGTIFEMMLPAARKHVPSGPGARGTAAARDRAEMEHTS